MSFAEYIDCQVYLSNYNDAVLHVVGWEYAGKPKLDNLQELLLNASLDTQQYGTVLFNALFPSEDNLRAGYREGLAVARHQGKGLRFRLHIATTAPSALHAFNWERLYDPQLKQAFARSQNIAFSRYLGTTANARASVETTPKLLVIVSTPANAIERGLAPIDRDEVFQIIGESLGPRGAQVEIFAEPPTRANIRQRLAKGGFDTLHVHAHAIISSNEHIARLVLERESGEADFVDETFFAEIFSGAPELRLITLMACHGGAQPREEVFSGLGPTLVREGYPAVVAMRQSIGIDAANVFTRHFYLNLAATGEVDVAANEARRQVLLTSEAESLDWSAPALFMSLQDGRLWNRPTTAQFGRGAPPMPPPDELFWRPIVQWARGRKIVPVIGSGINHGVFPSNGEITQLWAAEYEYDKYNYPSNNRNDLPRVARFVETILRTPKYPHGALLDLLKGSLLEREKIEDRDLVRDFSLSEVIDRISQRYFDKDKDDPHRVLAELPITTYLTTNPDNFMETALSYINRKPTQAICRWQEGDLEDKEYQQLRGTSEAPLVFHLYGADPSPVTLVLTEDDHLDFLKLVAKEDWRVPLYLRTTLTESMLLFVGFDVRDLDFRILLKAIVEQLKKTNLGRVAVLQIEPDESYQQKLQDLQLLQDYLGQDCSNLQVRPCWLSTRDFLIELRKRV